MISSALMAMKRGLSGASVHRNRGGGSGFPLTILLFFAVLVPFIFFVRRGLHATGNLSLSIFSMWKLNFLDLTLINSFKSNFFFVVIFYLENVDVMP